MLHMEMEKSDFLASVARKFLACLVVVLIIGVSVYAVVVVLRPGELTVSVVGGSLQLLFTTNQQELLFDIELGNLGGRGTIYYTGVTAQVMDISNNLTLINLSLSDMIVEQQSTLTKSSFAVLNNNTTTSDGNMFFTKISSGAEAVVILHGNLTTNLYALRNNGTTTPTTYACYNVTVDVVLDNAADKKDVICHMQLLKSSPERRGT